MKAAKDFFSLVMTSFVRNPESCTRLSDFIILKYLMVELKLFLMPPLKRSGRVKAFLENTTRRVEIFQKSRLGLDSSFEGRFHIFASKTVGFDRLKDSLLITDSEFI